MLVLYPAGLFWFRQAKLASSLMCLETGVGTEGPEVLRGSVGLRGLPVAAAGPESLSTSASSPSSGTAWLRPRAALGLFGHGAFRRSGCPQVLRARRRLRNPSAGGSRGGPRVAAGGAVRARSAAPQHHLARPRRTAAPRKPSRLRAVGGLRPNARLPGPGGLRGASCGLPTRAPRALLAARFPHGSVTAAKAMEKVLVLGALGAANATRGAILGG